MKEENFPEYLLNVRKLLKMSREQLGAVLGLSPKTIQNYEGGATPSPIKVKKLIDALKELVRQREQDREEMKKELDELIKQKATGNVFTQKITQNNKNVNESLPEYKTAFEDCKNERDELRIKLAAAYEKIIALQDTTK